MATRWAPNLDSPFKAGEHIPGLNVGGWQDAGDYDIQTPDNAWVVRDLVWAHELFGLDWDETSVDEAARAVEIRKPDGVQDALQQIRHGTLQLLAQYKVFGHAIVGIIDPMLRQYAHLGDAGSQTDRHDLRSEDGSRIENNGATIRASPTIAGRSPPICPPMTSSWRARSPAPAARWPRRIRRWRQRRWPPPRRCGPSSSATGRQQRAATSRFAPRMPERRQCRRRRSNWCITTKGDPHLRRAAAAVAACDHASTSTGSASAGGARHSLMDADYRAQLAPLVRAVQGEGRCRPGQKSVRRAGERRIMGGIEPGRQRSAPTCICCTRLSPRSSGTDYTLRRARLHAGASSGEQPVAGLDGRHAVQADRLWPQPRRL